MMGVRWGQFWHEKFGVFYLHGSRNAADGPVLNPLHAAILWEAQKVGNLRWASKIVYQLRVGMFAHGCITHHV
jgi:hypothetical protein